MIEVWGRRSSINVQKVLWALAETGQAFDRHAAGGQFGGLTEKDFLKMNPNGLVPVMKDGSLVLSESNAIMRYLARKFGKDNIRPRGQKPWALADQWTENGMLVIFEYSGPNRLQWNKKQLDKANKMLENLPKKYKILI